MKLMLFALLQLPFDLKAMECAKFQTKIINEAKEVVRQEELCILEKIKFTGSYSKNCRVVGSLNCPFHKVKKGLAYESFIKEIGSPSFNLCYYIGGQPQIYQIKIKDKWKPFERCFWQESKEFIELAELVEYYRSL